jgi:hypothetical protein
MGYRSEVVVAFNQQAARILSHARTSNEGQEDKDDTSLDSLLKAADRFIEFDGSQLYFWSSIKWYDEYSGVREFHHIMSHISSGDIEGAEFYFLRIGGDLDDIEEEGDWYNNPFNIWYKKDLLFTDPVKGCQVVFQLKNGSFEIVNFICELNDDIFEAAKRHMVRDFKDAKLIAVSRTR